MTTEDVNDKIFLARQPILDLERKTCAYELLFRSGVAYNGAVITDSTQATARVLVNILNSMGIEAIVGHGKAFINCDRRMLLERTFEALDPNIFVLEILEDVVGDELIADSVSILKDAGFEIALDDFVMTVEHIAKIKRFIPLVKYVKVDLMINSPAQIKASAELFKKFPHIQLLAEKVETEEQFRACKAMGYTLFQGYFFAKPEIIEGRKLDPKTTGVLGLLQVLRQDPEMRVLEEAFKRQPEVTVGMLKYINSASVGARSHIDSIRLALTMIGQRKLQQWLMLMVFAGSGPSNGSALFDNAAQRARLMENLAKKIDTQGNLHERAFLAGMLSRMDALCHVNIETILKEFDLGKELSEALQEHKGVLGDLLKITAALELDELDVTMGLCDLHHVSPDQLQSSLAESWSWVEAVRG